MCHHLTEAERERLTELAAEREGDAFEETVEEESEPEPETVPTPSD